MNTAQAIVALRKKLDQRQDEFAKGLDSTVTSVSRWEHGREPSRPFLKKLANLARNAGANHLAEFFEAARRADIVATVENLPSAQTTRRIPVHDLSAWEQEQESIMSNATHLLDLLKPPSAGDTPKEIDRSHFQGVLRAMAIMAGRTRAELLLQIQPPKQVVWDELSPETQASMLTHHPEKTKADIQAMQRGNEELWGRAEQEPKQTEVGSIESDPED